MASITISMEEYKELIQTKVRIDVFAKYVNSAEYSIGRRTCSNFLGFDLNESKEGDDD